MAMRLEIKERWVGGSMKGVRGLGWERNTNVK